MWFFFLSFFFAVQILNLDTIWIFQKKDQGWQSEQGENMRVVSEDCAAYINCGTQWTEAISYIRLIRFKNVSAISNPFLLCSSAGAVLLCGISCTSAAARFHSYCIMLYFLGKLSVWSLHDSYVQTGFFYSVSRCSRWHSLTWSRLVSMFLI